MGKKIHRPERSNAERDKLIDALQKELKEVRAELKDLKGGKDSAKNQ